MDNPAKEVTIRLAKHHDAGALAQQQCTTWCRVPLAEL